MLFIALLDNLDLSNLMKFKGHLSPKVVKAFYSTLEYRVRDRILLPEVIGKKILLNEAKLADILGIPAPRPEYFCFTDNHNSLSQSFYVKD